jgi:hypothetical protein
MILGPDTLSWLAGIAMISCIILAYVVGKKNDRK